MFKRITTVVLFFCGVSLVMAKTDTTNASVICTKAYSSLGANKDSAYYYATVVKRKTKEFKRSDAFNKANLVIAIYHQVLNNQDSATYYLKGILDKAEYFDKKLLVRVYIQLGIAQRLNGNFNESTEIFSKAYEVSLLINNMKLNLYSQFQLCSNYYQIGRYKEAVSICSKALWQIKKNNFKFDSYKKFFYNILGNCYNELNVSTAKPYFDSVLFIAKEISDSTSIYNAYNNLGNTFFLNNKFTESLQYFKHALRWNRVTNNTENLAAININLGNVYRELNESEKAIAFYEKGLEFAIACNSIEFKRNAYQGLTKIAKSFNNKEVYYALYDSLLTYQALILKLNKDQNVSKVNYYKDLAEERLVQKRLTIENLEKDILLRKRGVSLLIALFVVLILIILWVKLKRQIGINKIQSDELQAKNADLLVLGRKKDQMLSIIGHDLRGPLHNIIYLNNEFIDSNLDEKLYKKMLRDITEKTQNTANLIEGMLLWANTFLSSGLKIATFNTAEVLNSVVNQLNFNIQKKNLSIIKNIDDVTIETDLQTFQIVFRNLLSNAIKYTAPNKHLQIFGKISLDYYKLTIVDQGEGFKPEVLSVINDSNSHKINSTKGTNGEKGSGVGLKLSIEFAQMIKGSIKVLKTSSAGSTVEFSVPLVYKK